MLRKLFFVFICFSGFAQRSDTVYCDCNDARVIQINGNGKFGKTGAPYGEGKKNEISPAKQKTKYAFEKEHHTAWYKLIMNTEGHLCMDVIPSSGKDDYDFMIFRAERKNFCDSLEKYKIAPVRACISRNNTEIDGKTGLSFKGKKEWVKEGVGDSYLKPLYCNKGETYYLVLDNVYENGQGHTLKWYFEESVKIRGILTDENKQPVIADISLTGPSGDTIYLAKSNSNGIYEFETPLRRNFEYSLNFYSDSTFIYTRSLTLKDSVAIKDIRLMLPHLRKGLKYSVGSINFMPGLTQYLPQALPSINNLYMLMRKNKNLKIRIIGHSNGRDQLSESSVIKFTNGRAETIKNYLITKGIDSFRIETEGKGDKEMLFKLPKATFEQQIQNRRVEVMVLEY